MVEQSKPMNGLLTSISISTFSFAVSFLCNITAIPGEFIECANAMGIHVGDNVSNVYEKRWNESGSNYRCILNKELAQCARET